MDRNAPPQAVNIPIAVDLLPSGDRTAITVLLRAAQPIPPDALADALEQFAKQIIKEKAAKIVKPNRKLVLP